MHAFTIIFPLCSILYLVAQALDGSREVRLFYVALAAVIVAVALAVLGVLHT